MVEPASPTEQAAGRSTNQDKENHDPKSALTRGLRNLVLVAVGVIVVLVVALTLILRDNWAAQILFSLLLAIGTTAVSVYATWRYARLQSRDELTRYALLAFRHLDSLAQKIDQQAQTSGLDSPIIESWALDVDQAKWAWRDLLKDTMALQARLQKQSEEVVERYRHRIENAPSRAEQRKLIIQRDAEIARIEAAAPLPLRQTVKVKCPACAELVEWDLGTSAGATAWPICSACKVRFPIHRLAEGRVSVGRRSLVRVTEACPECGRALDLSLPVDEEVRFLWQCPYCRLRVQVTGCAKKVSVEKAAPNSEFDCPHCHLKSGLRIDPNRSVRFVTHCEVCNKPVQVEGSLPSYRVTALPSGSPSGN